MPLTDEEKARVAELRAELEALVGEQVLAFGFFGEPGYARSSPRFAQTQGFAGDSLPALFRNLFRRAKGGGLPATVVLAVTPQRLLVLSYSAGMGGVRVREVVRAWERASTRVEVAEERGSRPIVELGDPVAGDSVRLESLDVTGSGVNDEILGILRG